MIEWWGPVIIEYYGATEANGFTFCDSQEWLAHPGTVGKCILGELLILDEDGNPQPTGTPGTVWFKGATATSSTSTRPTRRRESRNEAGDTSTVGDVGYVDEDGYLYLTDRKTYMIISGGVNIYPQETENLLITHPKVMDAAVFGVPNEDLGEEVKAVVQLDRRRRARPRARARAHRVLPRAPRALQVPAHDRLRGRAAAAAHRQALQAAAARSVLGRAHDEDRLMDNVVDEMERAFALATEVLSRVGEDQWDSPSPCEGWTVRDVVNHMVGGAKIVSIELSGHGEGVNYYVNHLRGLDPVDAYRAASAEAVDVSSATTLVSWIARSRCRGVRRRARRWRPCSWAITSHTRGMSRRRRVRAPTSTLSSPRA